MPILASDLTRLLGNRGVTVYQDPFSLRAEEIARLAILRADVHGMKNYGPAPAPLDEKRDMYQEAIEELLDAIYYLTRQVARMEDQREKLTSAGGIRRAEISSSGAVEASPRAPRSTPGGRSG